MLEIVALGEQGADLLHKCVDIAFEALPIGGEPSRPLWCRLALLKLYFGPAGRHIAEECHDQLFNEDTTMAAVYALMSCYPHIRKKEDRHLAATLLAAFLPENDETVAAVHLWAAAWSLEEFDRTQFLKEIEEVLHEYRGGTQA